MTRKFIFNRCIHWERESKGKYIGLQNPLFDIVTFFFPLWSNDGDRGFIEWLIFRFGWYPLPPKSKSEINAYERRKLCEYSQRPSRS